MIKKSWIYVTFQKEGIHAYPAALTDPGLEAVKFLGYPHRHMFGFRIQIEVFHNSRDIEFIIFKRWIESLYSDDTLQLNDKSCETIAEELASWIFLKYPGRRLIIEVSEDGENGARLEWGREHQKEIV